MKVDHADNVSWFLFDIQLLRRYMIASVLATANDNYRRQVSRGCRLSYLLALELLQTSFCSRLHSCRVTAASQHCLFVYSGI